MKHVILSIILLLPLLSDTADPRRSVRVDVVKYILGTATERESYTPPAGERWEMTLDDGTVWENVGGSGWVELTSGGVNLSDYVRKSVSDTITSNKYFANNPWVQTPALVMDTTSNGQNSRLTWRDFHPGNVDPFAYVIGPNDKELFFADSKLSWRTSFTNGVQLEANNTAVRNYELPDKDGTFAMLDDLAGGSANSVLSPAVIADGHTLLATDGDTGRKVFYYDGSTDIDVDFPDVFENGEKVSFRQLGTGKIRVTFTDSGTGGGLDFQTASADGSVSVWKSPVRYVNEGNWSAYTSVTLLSTDLNAANSDDETNGTAGFGAFGGSLSSTGSSPIAGLYSILYERANSSGGERMTYTKSVTNGDVLRLRFSYQATGNGTMNNQQGIDTSSFSGSITFDGTTRTFDETFTVTDAPNFQLRWYPNTTGSWKLDNFILEKIN